MAVEYITGMDHHQKSRGPHNRRSSLPATTVDSTPATLYTVYNPDTGNTGGNTGGGTGGGPGAASQPANGPQTSCEHADINALSKLPGVTDVSPNPLGGPPQLVGGHYDYPLQVDFASQQGASNFGLSVLYNGWGGLDKGDRLGSIPSPHFKPDANYPYISGSTVDVLGHRDWFNPDWGNHVLFPLHFLFDVGFGHLFGLFGHALGGC